MGSLLEYSGITTKIHGMKKNLISDSVYRELSSMTSIQAAAELMKRQPGYADLFENISDSRYHRDEIEKLFKSTIFYDFRKIYLFCNQRQRKYLKLYFIRYEVTLLKSCLRIVFENKNVNINRIHIDFDVYREALGGKLNLDEEKLTQASTIEEFINNLNGTPYYPHLHRVSAREGATLFDYEMALDLYYFSTIWKKKNKVLSKKDLDIITRDQGSKIDLLNLIWIYRSKKYFKMSDVDVYALLIPVNYKLKKEEIKRAVEVETPAELINIIQNTYYGKKYADIDYNTIEELYLNIRNKLHDSQLLTNPYSMASINTYLYYKEREIDRLTTMFECIRYRIPPAEIMEYMNTLGGGTL